MLEEIKMHDKINDTDTRNDINNSLNEYFNLDDLDMNISGDDET